MEGLPLGVNGRSFFLDSTILPGLGTIHGRRHVGRVWGLFYYFIVPGEMAPHMRLRPTKGISIEWQELSLIYSSGLHTLVPTFFWQANSSLVR